MTTILMKNNSIQLKLYNLCIRWNKFREKNAKTTDVLRKSFKKKKNENRKPKTLRILEEEEEKGKLSYMKMFYRPEKTIESKGKKANNKMKPDAERPSQR